MPLDLKRLQRDVAALGRARATENVARGKASGAMAIVRTLLAEIERLRGEGATWTDIAAALAGQGVRRRDGAPITGRRLTGLIDSIRRQDAKRRRAMARRASRGDLPESPPGSRPPSRASTLGPPPRPDTPAAEAPVSEHRTAEQIRRDGLAELYDQLKGTKP